MKMKLGHRILWRGRLCTVERLGDASVRFHSDETVPKTRLHREADPEVPGKVHEEERTTDVPRWTLTMAQADFEPIENAAGDLLFWASKGTALDAPEIAEWRELAGLVPDRREGEDDAEYEARVLKVRPSPTGHPAAVRLLMNAGKEF